MEQKIKAKMDKLKSEVAHISEILNYTLKSKPTENDLLKCKDHPYPLLP